MKMTQANAQVVVPHFLAVSTFHTLLPELIADPLNLFMIPMDRLLDDCPGKPYATGEEPDYRRHDGPCNST